METKSTSNTNFPTPQLKQAPWRTHHSPIWAGLRCPAVGLLCNLHDPSIRRCQGYTKISPGMMKSMRRSTCRLHHSLFHPFPSNSAYNAQFFSDGMIITQSSAVMLSPPDREHRLLLRPPVRPQWRGSKLQDRHLSAPNMEESLLMAFPMAWLGRISFLFTS
jgi:hypothetical protein